MDSELLRHYHGPQAAPVFGKSPVRPVAPKTRLLPLIIYAALCGFSIVMCAVTLLQHLAH